MKEIVIFSWILAGIIILYSMYKKYKENEEGQ